MHKKHAKKLFLCLKGTTCTKCCQLQGTVLEGVTSLINNQDIQDDVILIDMDISFCVHWI